MRDHPEDIASLARELGLAWPISIPDIPPQEPIRGFFRSDCRDGLREIAAQVSPSRVLEIGAWFGMSTVFLSSLFHEVVTIDHWEGSDDECCRREARQCPHPLYQQFLANIQHCGNVLPLKCEHGLAKYLPLGTYGVVFIDGSHDYDSVLHDLRHYSQFVSPQGILCGDDYNWEQGTSVREAVRDFCAERNLPLPNVNGHHFWWFPAGSIR